jgi:hypothetical protein
MNDRDSRPEVRLTELRSDDLDEISLWKPPSWEQCVWKLAPDPFQGTFGRLEIGSDLSVGFPGVEDIGPQGLPGGAGVAMLTLPGKSQGGAVSHPSQRDCGRCSGGPAAHPFSGDPSPPSMTSGGESAVGPRL